MKYVACILILLFLTAMFSSCASRRGGAQNHSGCKAQKPNNMKGGRTFIY